MKKKTAWLWCISVTLVTVGYAAWCGRSFYLAPRTPDLSHLSDEYFTQEFPRLAAESGVLKPVRFRMDQFLSYLWQPYTSPSRCVLFITESAPGAYVFSHDHPGYAGRDNFSFIREDGVWKHVSAQECIDYSNVRNSYLSR